jgi:hypothetical protein
MLVARVTVAERGCCWIRRSLPGRTPLPDTGAATDLPDNLMMRGPQRSTSSGPLRCSASDYAAGEGGMA